MKNLPSFRHFVVLLFSVFLSPFSFASGTHSTGFEGPLGYNDAGNSSSLIYCPTPTWLETSNITSTAATFSWDAIPGAQSYSVQTRVPNGTWYNVPGSPTPYLSITVDWFLPNTSYEWRVKTNCSNGESSGWSNPVWFTTSGWGDCQAPSWLYTNNVTQNSATFDWEPVSGAMSYSLQYRIAGGSWYTIQGGPWTDTWYTITGLSPGTTYEWRVKSNCANWMYSDWSYSATFTTLYGYCQHPYWLYTTNITNNSARLDWESVAGAVNYTVQLRTSNGQWYDLPGGPFYGTWHTVNGLQPNTCYEWRVRTTCSNWTYSSWSYVQNFCTAGYSCSTPTWPSTWDISEETATFSWDAVWGAYNYVVQIRQGNGEWYDVAGSPTHYTWLTVYGLNSCSSYQWRVKAHCGGGGYSNWTQPISFTTYCEYYCHAPNWLYTNNITQNSATLDWDPVYGAVSYSIQYRVAGGSWDYLPGGPFTGTWATISGLQPGTSYEWRVRSNCSNWSSSNWSYPAYFTTLGSGCNRPSFLYTLDITAHSAKLDWSTSYGAWSYDVQIRKANGGAWLDVPGSPFTETSAIVTDLQPGTTYQWRVRSYCEDGVYSLWAKAVTFTTPGIADCDPPFWLHTTEITENAAKLDWANTYGAESYSIQFRVQGEEWTDVPAGVWTETWYSMTGLLPGTTYEWRIQSLCNYGLISEWSAIEVFTTLGPSCNTPTGGVTSEITDVTAVLAWSAVAGASHYDVEIRVPAGIWTPVPGSPVADPTLTATDLIPGTTYEWRVRVQCANGDHSTWADLVSFTTTGTTAEGSDECDGATALTVNSECDPVPASNEGATESSPAPMGWCAENEYNDVWFTFTMPDVADPVVTIRTMAGTLTDGIIEVYRGSSCTNLQYIFCEDDNGSNGSTMPVVTINGSANETIWVRVWGYAGTTGTFSICVFNYASTNLVVNDDDNAVTYDGQPIGAFDQAVFASKDISMALEVSPNPTRDILQVTLGQTAKTKVSRVVLLDMSGKIVLAKVYQSNDDVQFRDQLDVSTFAPGIYVLQVVTTGGVLAERISVVD
jgi:hypothetical protein